VTGENKLRKGFKRKFPPLEILSKEDVEHIKQASLDILRETGMVIEHKGALKLLEENDCIVDYDTMRVRFPESLVQECIRRCPDTFRVKAREPENDLIFGGNTTYFMSTPGLGTVDLDTWEYREPTKQEFIDAVTVLDSLEHHDWYNCYVPYFGYKGVPEVMKMTMGLYQRLKYSSKFTAEGFANYNWLFNFKLAKAAGCELMSPALMVSSPLALSEFAVEACFTNLEYGFPVGVDTGPVFGATAPATIAGSFAQYNAELLGSAVLVQCKKPYSRVFGFGFAHPQNMRNGAPAFGNIGITLNNVMMNQIWRDYGIPRRNSASTYTNSKKIDYQNAAERMLPAALCAVSGASSIHWYGGIYGEITFHPVQAILDDEIAGILGRFLEGVTVNDETVALDLIHSVGPVPGHFLSTKHTHDWWQKEQHVANVFDNLTYPEWERSGKKDCIDYGKEKMKKILETHEVKKLKDEQIAEMDSIVEEAELFYKKRGDL